MDPENKMSLGRAARHPELCVDGRHVHPGTLARWATRGVRGVLLATTRIGGRRLVTLTAIREFLRQLSGSGAQSTKPQLNKSQALAKRKLDEAGVTTN